MFDKRFKSHHDAEQFYSDLIKRERSSIAAVYEYLDNPITLKENAIYIHIPFCDRICSFCNMNRKYSNEPKDDYTNQLVEQISQMGKLQAFDTNHISAVYFGGGTPTTLEPQHFKQIIETIRENFILAEDVEITSETTLHNLTEEHVEVFNQVGVNRLSIGIQTFQTAGRKFFNRTYDKEETINRLKQLKATFNGYICVDKIYNYPGETEAMLRDDVKQIIDLELDSVSFYSLMLHEGSVLSKKYDESNFSDQQDLKFHDLFVATLLETEDYELMELTKIVRKNRDQYRYMSIRNGNGNTIPFGNGSGGKIEGFHIYNMDFARTMVAKSTQQVEETANAMYGLFQSNVVSKKTLENLANPLGNRVRKNLQILVDSGFIIETDTTIKLTNKGLFYGNNIGGLVTRALLEDKLEGGNDENDES
ncbi:coproporphyrinogen-III oxidase family protein [Mollicutes bacterium LVI A0039]|nr:coproporphyrinogen-III oxidase family protein [Mollicutes bacterium LVI A0039]